MGDPEDKGKPAKAKGKAKPPKLPDDAPQDVKDFVDCKGDSVTLDPTKKGFLPEIPVIGAPNVKIEKGAKAGTAKISLSKAGGLLDTSFTVGVKDGHLDADTTGVKPEFVKDEIDKWVKKYNDWLDAKKRKLQDVTVKDGKATITKVPVAAGQTSVPTDGPGWGKKVLVGTAVTVALVGGGYVAYNAISDDGGSADTGDAAAVVEPAANAFDCPDPASCVATYDALIQGVGVTINHTDPPPVDVITGEPGNSGAIVTGVTTWDDLIQIAAVCGGQTVTGQGQADADGVFTVPLPVYQFAPCEITEFKLKTGATFSDGLPVDALDITSFDVTENEVQVDQAVIQQYLDEISAHEDEVADAKAVADLFDPGNLCFVDTLLTDAPVRQAFAALCPTGQSFYGLQAVNSPDEGDPVLVGGVTFDGFDAPTLDDLFGSGGAFPCGDGDAGITVCPDPAATFPPGPLSIYQAVFPGGAPQDFTLTLPGQGEVTVEPDGADTVVSADGVDPSIRVILRDGAVTVVIAGPAPAGIRMGPNLALQPDPTVTLGGGAEQPPAEDDTVQAFATQLAQSLASDDHAFAEERLDPAVLQAFPTECTGHFANLPADPSYAITVVDVGQPAPYVYTPPSLGTSTTVNGVLVVTADITSDGTTDRAELHFGQADDGSYTWFTDCGRSP